MSVFNTGSYKRRTSFTICLAHSILLGSRYAAGVAQVVENETFEEYW